MMKLCIDLGATNVKSGLIDNGIFIKTATTKTVTDRGLDGVISSVKRAIDGLMSPEVTEICISSAGTIDSERGVVVYATDNLPGYTGFDITGWVKRAYGLKSVAINDGYAALLGEIAINYNYAEKKVIMLTLGSGVGGAYAVNGKIVAGEKNDFARFGHISLYPNGIKCNCGRTGCAERYLSGRAINALAGKYGIGENEVFNELKKGNKNAVSVVNEIRKNTALLLEKIYKDNPFDICIMGGGAVDGMGDSFDDIFGGLGYDVRRAKAGNNAGMLGAYYFSLDE